MKDNKVEQSDLIGKIKHFPIEIVQKMVDYQVAQGSKADVTVFQECHNASKRFYGFNWNRTEEGDEFWVDVILENNFKAFFDKYPKTNNSLSPSYIKFTRYNNLGKGQLCQMKNQIGWIRKNVVLHPSIDRHLEIIQDDLNIIIDQWHLNKGLINEMYGNGNK